jgi:hypothetical protein
MRKLFLPMIVLIFQLSIGFTFALDANGIVIDVLDGVTLDVRIEAKDPQIDAEVLRVQLANLSAPHISTPEGLLAKNFTSAALLNRSVWLYVQDNSIKGRNSSEVIPCVVYHTGPDGQTVYPSFNEILAKSGYIRGIDSQKNDSDPLNQWLKDVWLPESLKEPAELLETEIPAFSRIKEPDQGYPDYYQGCPDCYQRCPPGEVCVYV